MSYILEALKKSQQERELGQVPTLDTTGVFSEDREPAPVNHWGLLAVGLAALAVVIALFAAFRAPSPPPVNAIALEMAEGRAAIPPAAGGLAPTRAASLSEVPATHPDATLPVVSSSPLAEAPPPKRPLRAIPENPRPPDASARQEADKMRDYPDPNLDPALELELQRQLDAEQRQFEDAKPVTLESLPPASIPIDLIDEIESFKEQVLREQGHPPPPTSGNRSKPFKIDGDPTRLRLTSEQQAQLPGYLMTVHVYDPAPAKRFVLINALKYREGEETREGLRIERILADGVVLSHDGNPFFVAR